MTSQYEIPPHTYRFPYRINMPLLILFWDAKQLGITFVTIASGNIFDFFITSVVVAVVFWFAYKKAAEEGIREVAIKWSAAPDMTPQTVLYRRPVAQFSNFQPKIVSSWLILALFQANFLISGRSRLCPYQLVNSNQVRQGE